MSDEQEVETPAMKALVYKYWRWYVDTLGIDDASDEALMLRAYMRKIARGAFALGRDGSLPPDEGAMSGQGA